MKILFVSANFPADPKHSVHGAYKRMGMLIEALNGIARLELLFYVPPHIDIAPPGVAAIKSELARLWRLDDFELTLCHKSGQASASNWWRRQVMPVVSLFHQSACDDAAGMEQTSALEACLARKPDTVFAHRLSGMCALLRTDASLPPVFFDMDDIEHIAFARSIGQPPHWRTKRLQYLQLPALRAGERRAVMRSHTTLVCSESDRVYLSGKFGCNNIAVLPNAVDIPPVQPPQAAPTLLFIGSFNYRPNINAADFLIARIWPRIIEALPDARLIIAGAGPENIAGFHGKPAGVSFTGFVEDLDAVYRDTRVVCCPILSGGGTRIKILEAAAYGKPIVATTLGAEGIELSDGKEILLRDDARDFADACIGLLQNQDACHRLGTAARAAIAQRYERGGIIAALRTRIEAALQ